MNSAQKTRKQLEELYEHHARLKEQHKNMIHVVASSPSKQKKTKVNATEEPKELKKKQRKSEVRGKRPVKQHHHDERVPRKVSKAQIHTEDHTAESHKIKASYDLKEAEEMRTEQYPNLAVVDATVSIRPLDKEQVSSIRDQPTDSPEASQDTFGRQLDSDIRKNVEQMICVDIAGVNPGHEQPALSPAFFTAKRKSMYCEMDDPGKGISYPKMYHKKGFLKRMLSCFYKPSVYSPVRGTPPPRPAIEEPVAPMLTLENEVAPLRQSISSIQSLTKSRDDLGHLLIASGPLRNPSVINEPILEDNGVKRPIDQQQKDDHTRATPLRRQDSYESLIAEAGDTPAVHTNQTQLRNDIATSATETRQTTVAVTDLLHACAECTHTIQRSQDDGITWQNRCKAPLRASQSLPSSPEKKQSRINHDFTEKKKNLVSKIPPPSQASSAPVSRCSSPSKHHLPAPRMTKAAMARQEATKRMIESRRKEEQAHWHALPQAVKASMMTNASKKTEQDRTTSGIYLLTASEEKFAAAEKPAAGASSQAADMGFSPLASMDSAAILSNINPNHLHEWEEITSQSLSKLPAPLLESLKSPESLECFQNALARASRSDNPLDFKSMSFSDDPFFLELSKIDSSITAEDLEKLKEALLTPRGD